MTPEPPPPPLTPVPPAGRTFGTLTIGPTTVRLDIADRCPTNRGYYLHDDEPAIEFGPSPDSTTVANGLAAMVMLLKLCPPLPPRGGR